MKITRSIINEKLVKYDVPKHQREKIIDRIEDMVKTGTWNTEQLKDEIMDMFTPGDIDDALQMMFSIGCIPMWLYLNGIDKQTDIDDE